MRGGVKMNKTLCIAKFLTKSCFSKGFIKLKRRVYTKVGSLTAEYASSAEPVSRKDGRNLEYRRIGAGRVWSRENYGCAWFRFSGEIPECAKGKKVGLLLDVGAEGCIYDENGSPRSGLTGAHDFVELEQPNAGKHFYELKSVADGGEKIEIWADCGNNCFPCSPFTAARFKRADIVIVDEEAKSAYYDAVSLLYQQSLLRFDDNKRKSVSRSLGRLLSFALSGDYENAKKVYSDECETGDESPYVVYATGHAHLDLAWLWPIRESKRKAQRTFANQLRNIERYPDYIFGASQPQQFAWIEDSFPALFEELRAAFRHGQLELQGGMWVECDTNIPSGESLIRQCLYGQKYWKEKFGCEVRMCWLPDVFGFSGNLPQIIRKCGMDYLETIKLSWNEHNKFSHKAFVWEGIDDSEVIVHIPPDETYNSLGNAWSLQRAAVSFPEHDKIKSFAMLYGIGDGGGGPGEGHIEAVRRCGGMKGIPKVVMSRAVDYLDILAEQKDSLARYKGELYLEKHQGTYTTQSKNKYYNRRIEFALHNVEFLATAAREKGYKYPKERLEAIWKEVLLYQFHDIIPGSSIGRVYKESTARYEAMLEELDALLGEAVGFLSAGKSSGATAINLTSARYKGTVYYKDKWYTADIEPYSSRKLTEYSVPQKSPLSYDDEHIESDLFRLTFNKNGNIKSLVDKRSDREFAGEYLNKLNVYRDKRLFYNAWDISVNYTKKKPAEFKLASHSVILSDASVTRENVYTYGKSSIIQKVVLTVGSPIVEFTTEVDWRETHKMLRADFRPSVYADEVTCDIQMGNIKRSTRTQTKTEWAQFEICAHKWVDVTDGDAGVSVLTTGKYGWRVKDGLLSLNLLRSAVWPDPAADKGVHTIKYALYPHAGDYNQANTQSVAYFYNNPLFITESDVEIAPQITSSDEHIVIETIKPAEDGNGIVLRLYEDSGLKRTASLSIAVKGKAFEADMLENPIKETDISAIEFKPFEIKTIVIKQPN